MKKLESSFSTFPSGQGLAGRCFSDKVLQNMARYSVGCNTLSGGCHATSFQTRRTARHSFPRTAMLEDRAPGRQVELFHSIRSAFPGRGWILQQFHPQWGLVHAPLCSTLRRRWTVFHSNVGFSRAGSLTHALVDLITRSSTGMSAEQLGTKLRCRCHSVLVQLCRQARLQRHRIGSSYIYFAPDPGIAAVQRQTTESLADVPLPAEIAVLILVEYIRRPDSSFEQLAKAISRDRGVIVRAAQIERLFDRHGLKKTIRIVPPKP